MPRERHFQADLQESIAIAYATIVRWAWTSADKHEPIGKCASVLSWPSATSPRRFPNFSTISAKAATRSQVRDGAPLRRGLRDFQWTNARSRIQPRPGRFLGSTSPYEGIVPIDMDLQERRARCRTVTFSRPGEGSNFLQWLHLDVTWEALECGFLRELLFRASCSGLAVDATFCGDRHGKLGAALPSSG